MLVELFAISTLNPSLKIEDTITVFIPAERIIELTELRPSQMRSIGAQSKDSEMDKFVASEAFLNSNEVLTEVRWNSGTEFQPDIRLSIVLEPILEVATKVNRSLTQQVEAFHDGQISNTRLNG